MVQQDRKPKGIYTILLFIGRLRGLTKGDAMPNLLEQRPLGATRRQGRFKTGTHFG